MAASTSSKNAINNEIDKNDPYYIPTVPMYRELGVEHDDTIGDGFFDLHTFENTPPLRRGSGNSPPGRPISPVLPVVAKPRVRRSNSAEPGKRRPSAAVQPPAVGRRSIQQQQQPGVVTRRSVQQQQPAQKPTLPKAQAFVQPPMRFGNVNSNNIPAPNTTRRSIQAPNPIPVPVVVTKPHPVRRSTSQAPPKTRRPSVAAPPAAADLRPSRRSIDSGPPKTRRPSVVAPPAVPAPPVAPGRRSATAVPRRSAQLPPPPAQKQAPLKLQTPAQFIQPPMRFGNVGSGWPSTSRRSVVQAPTPPTPVRRSDRIATTMARTNQIAAATRGVNVVVSTNRTNQIAAGIRGGGSGQKNHPPRR